LYAQKHDNIWLFGYGGGNQSPLNDKFGVTMFDFGQTDFPKVVNRQDIDMNFFTTNAGICDSAGNLMLYSNGEKVYSHNHKLLSNGNALTTDGDGSGYRAPQCAIVLNKPKQHQIYSLFNVQQMLTPVTVVAVHLLENEIDMKQNNNLGKVVIKGNKVLIDTITWGRITAVKHANGRDWWLCIPTDSASQYYIGLLDDKGFKITGFQKFESSNRSGLGQAVFSPDGTRYIVSQDVNSTIPPWVCVYDFDRCTGQLSNQRTWDMKHQSSGIGAGVSLDSKYLYVTESRYTYQYDLTAPDIAATETLVAKFDGFVSSGDSTYFFLQQLGPDGRIYVASLNSTQHLHYINFPSRAGEACRFVQHGIALPTVNRYAIPNLPNFRLGPIDGSPCDTLGLDNHPLCNFRWEQEDTLGSPLQVTFTDLSAYEPAEWHWDFGDGTTSQDTSPVHEYAKKGVYEVCLIVRNQYSADTLCRWVNLGTSSTHDPVLPQAQVFPNPTTDALTVRLSLPPAGQAYPLHFALTDALGRTLREAALSDFETIVDVSGLPPGLYFWRMSVRGEVVQAGKVVKEE